MKPDIQSKLRHVLESGRITEVEVVYIMAGIRKLLEHGKTSTDFRTLEFFGDWALHVKMDRRAAVRMIKQFDDIWDAHWSRNETGLGQELGERVLDLTDGTTMRDQLRAFLRANQLPTTICDETLAWQRFIREYGNVITDCPLEYNLVPVKHVKSVTVSRKEAMEFEGPGMRARFALEWRLKFFDRKDDYSWTCDFVA
ncbi:MAG: hypothetical protein ABSH49_17305 [Bryobacteraceae bacterium]|jgi:hypothetical protein